jgi:S1-C subfamily serine protease
LLQDIIKELNGKTVKTLDGLITELRKKRAGDEVEILIQRGQQQITLVFTLDLRPSDS